MSWFLPGSVSLRIGRRWTTSIPKPHPGWGVLSAGGLGCPLVARVTCCCEPLAFLNKRTMTECHDGEAWQATVLHFKDFLGAATLQLSANLATMGIWCVKKVVAKVQAEVPGAVTCPLLHHSLALNLHHHCPPLRVRYLTCFNPEQLKN